MPLIIITGFPCSGKSRRSEEINQFFKSIKGKDVCVVSENDTINSSSILKNDLYFDSQKEKVIRAILKSKTLRLLGPENLVILDAGNYIKGFRYELYCESKNSNTTQVTVECAASAEQAWQWNHSRPESEQYSREAFDALTMRYEAPDSRNRWDSPLVTLQPEDTISGEHLFNILYLRRPPPPNQSTQSAPLSYTNFLYDLDRVTLEIVKMITSAQRLGVTGEVKLAGYDNCVLNRRGPPISPAQLTRHRRQFLNYTRINPPTNGQISPHHLAQLFVQFLNTTLSGVNSQHALM